MKRVHDPATLDLFTVPQPVVPIPGDGNYAVQSLPAAF